MNETITIQLNIFERRFLLFLAERGGRLQMENNGLEDNAIKALASLKDKKAIGIEPTLFIGRKEYILTSIGVNLVDMIKKEIAA
jgi:hypothetical protein